MVTVEADQARVESRLADGRLSCPGCGGRLRRWGWARARRVHGLPGPVRPRRARCSSCGATHVLLPLTLLLRRGWSAATVWAAVVARGCGAGFRPAAAAVGAPATTVRGWLRRLGGRLAAVREAFTAIGVAFGVDARPPDGLGCPWRDLLAAVGMAVSAVRGRFGGAGLLGAVTAGQVAVAGSGGRLLAPGWPPRRPQHDSALPPGALGG